MNLTFGNTPVPYAALWSPEERLFVAACATVGGRLAMCNPIAQGEGRPMFGKPHMQRQREVILGHRCDLCAKPLKNRTKVSLSHAKVVTHGAEGAAVLQVEPLLHKECAAISMRYCPSLRRQDREDRLHIRLVTQYRTQVAILSPEAITELSGEPPQHGVIGHAKVELLKWQDKTPEWLGA